MKIYTRTGDAGETALFGGGRVDKCHPRVKAYGTVDELNALLGSCIAKVQDPEIRSRLEPLQHDLFGLGAELATPQPKDGRRRPATPPVPVARVDEMENWIDHTLEEVEPLKDFILPGGSPGAAALHVARTVCRRAERDVVALARMEPLHPGAVRYLNRLSDLLFAFARLENHRVGVPDIVWRKDGDAGGEVTGAQE